MKNSKKEEEAKRSSKQVEETLKTGKEAYETFKAKETEKTKKQNESV